MRLTKRQFEILVESLLIEQSGMHRCMNGKLVRDDSLKCLNDIEARISDAEHHRSSHNCGTEDRVYYNGLLKGLRKKRRRLQKIHLV